MNMPQTVSAVITARGNGVSIVSASCFVNMITHKPLHLAW